MGDLDTASAASSASVRVPAPDDSPARAPLAYTLPHLADKIRTTRATLEGERKHVTVLFADLKDSTELIRGLDPEAAQQLLDPAIRVLEPGLALCRASGDRSQLRQIAATLGYASALQRCLAERRVLLEEAISEAIRPGGLIGLAYRVAWLSEVCRLAGRGEEAWQRAGQALALDRQLKERGHEALVLHQLGVVQTHADPPDVVQAEAYYQQALALAEELGMRPLQAHCHRGLSLLYSQTGQAEQARTALATAIVMYLAFPSLPEAFPPWDNSEFYLIPS
jgi:class 3 adenylate cyclase